MHEQRDLERVLTLGGRGYTASAIARETGIPRSTVRDWPTGLVPRCPHGTNRSCGETHVLSELPPVYLYLLGLYLGDGCSSTSPGRVPKLRIALDARYPEIALEAKWAIGRIRGVDGYGLLRPCNYIEVYSYWKHWPCLLPQPGPGKKHERPIVLADWQQQLAAKWPWELARGLVHSDGCRFLNRCRGWSAPRYSFKQTLSDIRAIFCSACDQLGVRCTEANDTIYVSRKADVAVLDRYIGPKR